MATFRFQVQRIEVREATMVVEAESFSTAAALAENIDDKKLPRGARMTKSFSEGPPLTIAFEIRAGREVV